MTPEWLLDLLDELDPETHIDLDEALIEEID